VDVVTNLYVVTKPVTAYDSSVTFVPAVEWDKKGRPPIVSTVTLFGIVRLYIIQEKPEPDPVFIVEYEKWFTEKDPKSATWELAFIIRGFKIKDRLSLKKDRKDWVIYNIDRIEETPVKIPF
jgi:hypothetical protein